MTRVLVTGANGFIGRQLVKRLLSHDGPISFTSLVLLDLHFEQIPPDDRVITVTGSIADPALLALAFAEPFDLIFHLVSIAGGAAEGNFLLGRAVNLEATEHLLELARVQDTKPIIVYSSSIGVFGKLPDHVTDETPANPDWSYGTHKLIGELLMSDYSRKNFVDARCLRFPGIVARPAGPSGALSAFLSELILVLAAGNPFTCPVSPQAQSWWMSVECCVDNVVHAATMTTPSNGHRRVWTLPPLYASIAEVVQAVTRVYKTPVENLITYAPDPALEERFGRLPPASFPASEAAGFHSDGTLDDMVRNALV